MLTRNNQESSYLDIKISRTTRVYTYTVKSMHLRKATKINHVIKCRVIFPGLLLL